LAVAVRPARPTAVKVAVWLIVWALIVNMAATLATLASSDGSVPDWPLHGATAAGFVVALGLVAAIAFGRRWALVAYTVVFAFGSILSLPSLLTESHTTVSLAWFAVGRALDATAIVLLFGRPATAWFAAYRPPRPGRPDAANPPRPAVPAAWHPDPTGRHAHRFWDGTTWTAHVADGGQLALDPLMGGDPSRGTIVSG
jgi:hypothetical protein